LQSAYGAGRRGGRKTAVVGSGRRTGIYRRERVRALRARRNAAEVARALTALDDAAAGTANLVTPIVGAVKALATVGEIADVLRARFGEYTPAT